jgi:type VI secretion system secreted protein VgrG
MRVCVFSLLFLPLLAVGAYADILGTASTFAVLGASEVTNTGATTLGGDLGVYPSASITGSGTITLSGSVYTPTVGTLDVAKNAQAAASAAYTILENLVVPVPIDLTGTDLGLLPVLTAGVYKFDKSAQLTGALNLNFTGIDQTFVFQIGTTLTTASGSSVLVNNLYSGDHVYWQVGSAATIGTTTSFMGSIIAYDQVAMQTGATDGCGNVISLIAAVTLDNNTISTGCTISTGSTGTPPAGTPIPTITPPTTTTVVPEPGTWLLLGSIIAVLAAQRKWARAKV